jgi:isoleucyl-tRNA synthetase
MALDALEARWTTHEEMLRLPVPQTGKIRRISPEPRSHNELDQWILSALQDLLQEYSNKMEAYDLEGALRPIPVFIDQLNNWYLRRNRQRFWASGLDEDKTHGYETLHHVLQTMAKVLAPICPFFAEELFQNLDGGESVHLELIPQPRKEWQDETLVQKMEQIRDIVGLSAGIRARAKIKLRQPLGRVQVSVAHPEQLDLEVIAAEANVKTVELLSEKELAAIATKIVKVNARMVGKKFGPKVQELIQKGKAGEFTEIDGGEIEIAGERLSPGEYEMGYLTAEGIEAEASANAVVLLDTEITPELEIEGLAREIIRTLQELRKNSGFEISDHIAIQWNAEDEKVIAAFTHFGEKIASEVLADSVEKDSSVTEELLIDDLSCKIRIEKRKKD